ncbi:MAG: peptidoglycan endopeptidase [Sphingomicrobium sp.]
MDGRSIVARARKLVGTRFLPQGRDPSRGIDCLGLAQISYAVSVNSVRDDYQLSGSANGDALLAGLAPHFRRISRGAARPGDLMLLRPGRDQWHVAVLTEFGFVHADARRRAVIETPGDPEWPVAAYYRRRRINAKRGR